MPLVAFTGLKGSGKSTAAQILMELGYTSIAFADPLKEVCKIIFGFSHEQMTDPIQKETVDPRYETSPRRILQTVGTTLFRETLPMSRPFTSQIWIQYLKNKLDTLRASGIENIVVSDLRFEDEADFLRNEGAKIIHIFRHPTSDTDTSEKGVSFRYKDLIIDNRQNSEELRKRVISALTD